MENIESVGSHFYILNIIYVLIFVFLFWIAYIKIMYPFWNTQPVFHSYDFWRYWARVPFIIRKKKGLKPDKFCDFENIVTMNFLDMPTEYICQMVDFLQCNYIHDESVLFLFHSENLSAYFAGHLIPSYVSFYMGTHNGIHTSLGDSDGGSGVNLVQKKRIDACITSRNILLKYGGDNANANPNASGMNVYFMDFIALRRGGNIACSRKLMATHCWHTLGFSGASGENIKGAIFRKEGEPFPGIRAFLRFDANMYRIEGVTNPALPFHFVLTSIHADNAWILTEFLENSYGNMDGFFAMTSISNLVELVKMRVLFIYLIQRADSVFCLYIFRDTRCQYELNSRAMLQLVCSIQKSNSSELFYCGFLNAIHDILKSRLGKAFGYLMVDDVADNSLIVENFPSSAFLEKTEVNYYAYNMVMPTVNNKKAWIIL